MKLKYIVTISPNNSNTIEILDSSKSKLSGEDESISDPNIPLSKG